jgi:hypothetical protein
MVPSIISSDSIILPQRQRRSEETGDRKEGKKKEKR